ncbi:hypothetical protein BJY24_002933 [Nocardia transvalensis]|uniref:Uncharacterized protein n=1 Tax=Nocardia transvalensis TaxID=37333 RepID=A0A7W9PDB0_9NOCA|nr:hypothetical protein [Nocardia transvalensis]
MAQPPSSTSSTTVVSSGSGTITLGPGQSLLKEGALRPAIESLGREQDGRPALVVVVQERLLSIMFAPSGTPARQFDPNSLPCERIPDLVEEATTGLGVGSPQTWQITVERLTGGLTIRVAVTGADGAALLEADEHGAVVRRVPAR